MEGFNTFNPDSSNEFYNQVEDLLINTSFKGDFNFNNSNFREFNDQFFELVNLHGLTNRDNASFIKNISESSSISHKTQRTHWGNQSPDPIKFICHTKPKDPDPWVIIEFSETIRKGNSVYVFNRCGTREVSIHIKDSIFCFSPDQSTWHELTIDLSTDQIFNSEPIRLTAPVDSRFLRITKTKLTMKS